MKWQKIGIKNSSIITVFLLLIIILFSSCATRFNPSGKCVNYKILEIDRDVFDYYDLLQISHKKDTFNVIALKEIKVDTSNLRKIEVGQEYKLRLYGTLSHIIGYDTIKNDTIIYYQRLPRKRIPQDKIQKYLEHFPEYGVDTVYEKKGDIKPLLYLIGHWTYGFYKNGEYRVLSEMLDRKDRLYYIRTLYQTEEVEGLFYKKE